MKTVAVERGLEPVKRYLQAQGLQVVELTNAGSDATNWACCCVTGADENVMGMQDVQMNCPIVSCEGLTPEEVYQRVERYVH